MKIDFSDKTVLVTGATRGIGRQIAEDLLEMGARLILTGTKQQEIDNLNARSDDRQRYICADFSKRDSLDAFLEKLARYDRIDVCVNNAGINRVDSIDRIRDGDWDDVFEVNLRAPTLITRTVSRIMKKNLYGRIVNISSVWGHVSWTRRTVYASTKFGIRGLTVASSNDLAKFNILVNAVSPGFTLTELVKENFSGEELKAIESRIPLGRMATPGEISKVVLFLASSLNSYLTGQSIIVDGGYVSV